jgi:4-alpha-glucanotransferase
LIAQATDWRARLPRKKANDVVTARARRRSGLLIPLFSFPSARSWGIGEIGDLAPMTRWLAASGQSVLQLLPLTEMASGQQSPYSAMSAMAIDPIFILVSAVAELAALGGESSLSADDRRTLDDIRHAGRVDYAAVRSLKKKALASAFEQFEEAEWQRDTERARRFTAFVEAKRWWLEDYALFRALHEREANRAWTEWPEPLRRRDPDALDGARKDLAGAIRFYQYLQWIAYGQWQEARSAASACGVELFGDLPFMVDADSADVWARQQDFDLDVSIGVPPDAFSATGQDWGMPLYRWDAIASGDFSWLRRRARRNAELYAGYRVDHLVGFYRTFGRPRHGGEPFFSPADEQDQVRLGEKVLDIMREPGSEIIAEDLGIVPDFVRASLARLGVPGFRVFRWERKWYDEGQPFRDPADYERASVATSGTHDTETLRTWWEHLPVDERRKVSALPTIQRMAGGGELSDASYDETVRDALLEALFASGSDILLLPVQDVFGWRDRINEPATVGLGNWTYRLPWPCDRLDEVPEARERRDRLREWAERHLRTKAP